ncbi:hypothetical protein V8E55_004600 [Tylopilus felleus]
MPEPHNKFDSPLAIPLPSLKPCLYKPNLTPAPTSLCPHCLANQCLALWLPSITSPHTISSNRGPPLSDTKVKHVLTVLSASLAESTHEVYSTSLLIFYVYCDTKDIPDDNHIPTSPNLLEAFLSSCTGAYSTSTIANYTTAIKAWHILHGLKWSIIGAKYKALF